MIIWRENSRNSKQQGFLLRTLNSALLMADWKSKIDWNISFSWWNRWLQWVSETGNRWYRLSPCSRHHIRDLIQSSCNWFSCLYFLHTAAFSTYVQCFRTLSNAFSSVITDRHVGTHAANAWIERCLIFKIIILKIIILLIVKRLTATIVHLVIQAWNLAGIFKIGYSFILVD